MMPSPCLSPLFITDCYGRKRSVPCGHCAACLVNKGLARTERLQSYTADYPYQWFLTLTYNDSHLPLALLSHDDACLYSQTDCDYNGEVYHVSLSDLDKESLDYISKCMVAHGGVPILSHRHIINFKKRLRYYLQQKFPLIYDKFDLFIYNTGEYGPTNFRPHYHLILCSRENIATSLLKECCSKAWSLYSKDKSGSIREEFGFIYLERVGRKGCESYIEKYINCTTNLPSILRSGAFRQFSSGSTRIDSVFNRLSISDIKQVYYLPAHEVFVSKRGKSVFAPVPFSYKDRYFPRIPRFSQFADYELYILYSLYRFFPKGVSAKESYTIFKQFIESNLTWLNFIEFNNVFVGRNYSYRPETLLEMLVDSCCFRNLDNSIITDEFVKQRNFSKLFYISKRVCINADLVGVSVNDYVDTIISYYKRAELDKLARFYKLQETLLNDSVAPLSLDKIFPMYFNTDAYEVDIDYYIKQFGWHGSTIVDISMQRNYEFMSKSILLDTTKTKKRNDYNFSRGLHKRPFIPYLYSNINKFISI